MYMYKLKRKKLAIDEPVSVEHASVPKSPPSDIPSPPESPSGSVASPAKSAESSGRIWFPAKNQKAAQLHVLLSLRVQPELAKGGVL